MDIFILGGARTPSGSYLGSLSSVSAPELGAVAISGALEKANIKKENVDEVAMGHVVQAGTPQSLAQHFAPFASKDGTSLQNGPRRASRRLLVHSCLLVGR